MNTGRDTILMVRGLTKADKKKLHRMARAEGLRTMSALVRKLIFDHIRKTEKKEEGSNG